MSKRIQITVPREFSGKSAIVPIIVDWFPRLTEEQIMANAFARVYGQHEPFPNPNLIDVEVTLK